MELTAVRSLVAELRALGVTKYKDADVELELGPEPMNRDPVPDLARMGFTGPGMTQPAEAAPARNPRLQRLLDRLDPAYSDASLFEIK